MEKETEKETAMPRERENVIFLQTTKQNSTHCALSRESERLLRLQRGEPHGHLHHHLVLQRLDRIRRPREHSKLGNFAGLRTERDEIDAVDGRLLRVADLRFELERLLVAVVAQPLPAVLKGRAKDLAHAAQ